jgi:hypothetical protein
MIDAHDVAEFEVRAQARQPPRVIFRGVSGPVVEWVAPELSVSRKIIGRHAGDRGWLQRLAIELKQVRTRPDISAVECSEDWRVADDLNPELGRLCTNLRPLTEEQILDERVTFGARGDFLAQRGFLRGRE